VALNTTQQNADSIFEVILDASGFSTQRLVSVLALLLYSLKFLSLPLYLRTLPVNLLLLLVLDFLLALELVSNKSTAPCSECTTNQRSRNRMMNGTADQTASSGSAQRPNASPFLCGGQIRAAYKYHHEK